MSIPPTVLMSNNTISSGPAYTTAVPPWRAPRARLAAALAPRVYRGRGRARARQLRFESTSPQPLEVGRVEDSVARGGGEVRGECGMLAHRCVHLRLRRPLAAAAAARRPRTAARRFRTASLRRAA
eukprot:scaffold82391_cov57-Phaeocystis_antarctica.AAC.1